MAITSFFKLASFEHAHWMLRARRKLYLSLLVRHFGHARPARALEIGSGSGGFLKALSNFAGEVHHADLDFAKIARSRAHGFRDGVVADAVSLPYAEHSFDLVCMFDVLEHVREERRALREAMRVLRPGGLLLAAVPAYGWMFVNRDRAAGHQRRYTRRRLRTAMAHVGFKLERNTHTHALFFPVVAVAVAVLQILEHTRLLRRKRKAGQRNLKLPRLVNLCLYRVFGAELVISSRFDLPFGHSIVAIARAPTGRPYPLRRRHSQALQRAA